MVPPAAMFDIVDIFPVTDSSTCAVPDRLTIQGVAKRRAASGRLVAGAAATADLELFKGRTSHAHKPLAKRWDHRLSRETLSRGGSSLKNAAVFLKNPGLISLGGGLPSSEYFPFDEINIKVPKLGYCAQQLDGHAESEVVSAGMHDMTDGKSAFDIAIAAQYGQGHGAPQLLRWLVEHTEIVHNPPYQDWSCTMTVGSTMAWDMTLRMMTRPGDWVLSEEFTFTTAVESAAPMGVRVAAVAMDTHGMIPASLDHVLSNWDGKARGGPKPFLLYTVPTGQNPTGSTQPIERRREIYAIAQKHDLYIFEDEPYYFLQMQEYKGPDSSPVPPPESHEEFLKSIVPSFLSLDIDGRVMRADSFSKVIAPGSRIGWITASEQICCRYRTHADVCTQGPSGFSQLILFKLLDESWGHAGYLDWLIHMRLEYTRRRNVMLEACERYLPRDIVSWVPPMAGMFHWMELDYTKHPHYPQKRLEDIEEEIFMTIVQHGTLLMKGSWFRAERDQPLPRLFFRATYAAAKFDQIDEAIKRFGDAVRDAFELPHHSNGLANGSACGLVNGQLKALTNGYTNGYANGHTNGHTNGHIKGHANGYTNGHINGHVNGHTNGVNGTH